MAAALLLVSSAAAACPPLRAASSARRGRVVPFVGLLFLSTICGLRPTFQGLCAQIHDFRIATYFPGPLRFAQIHDFWIATYFPGPLRFAQIHEFPIATYFPGPLRANTRIPDCDLLSRASARKYTICGLRPTFIDITKYAWYAFLSNFALRPTFHVLAHFYLFLSTLLLLVLLLCCYVTIEALDSCLAYAHF